MNRKLGWAYILYMLYVMTSTKSSHMQRHIHAQIYAFHSARHIREFVFSLWYMHIDFCKHSNVQKRAIFPLIQNVFFMVCRVFNNLQYKMCILNLSSTHKNTNVQLQFP